MFLILFAVVLGFSALIWGVTVWSDPNCSSASISIRWRNVDVNCFPVDARVAGPIPGWVLSITIIGVGLMSLAGAYFSFIQLRKRKNAKNAGQALAVEILGTVRSHAPAVYSDSKSEGNLFWSGESFLFLLDEPLPDGTTRIGPIHFSEINQPTFRMPLFSSDGCVLNFDDGKSGLTFTSSSGKMKNLMKDFRKFKEVN
jgi:hypothetical protein